MTPLLIFEVIRKMSTPFLSIDWGNINWDIIGIVFSLLAMLVGYYVFSLKTRRANRFRKNILRIRSKENIGQRIRELRREQVLIEDQYQKNKISDTQYLILKNLLTEILGPSRKMYLSKKMKGIPRNLRELLSEHLEDGVITSNEFEDFQKHLAKTKGFDEANKQELEKIMKSWMLSDKKITRSDETGTGMSVEAFAARNAPQRVEEDLPVRDAPRRAEEDLAVRDEPRRAVEDLAVRDVSQHTEEAFGVRNVSQVAVEKDIQARATTLGPVFVPPESDFEPTSSSGSLSLFDIQIVGGSSGPKNKAK